MAGGRIQKRPGLDDQVGHRRVGRHLRQPFDQRLRPRHVGRIDPAFHGEAAARAHIQRRVLRDLHISVRAGKLKLVAAILQLKRLPDFARREIEPADQRAVVAVVFRIGTVAGVALAAPPAGDARAAIPVRSR